MDEYRVNLDIYNGPMDLLLYLIRREEVDIYDIPIARITEQYVRYVDMIHQLDPNLAGEFLVLAATLIEIKTRMLLPSPPVEEGEATGLAIDPRAELVRQLLEYKAFKDAAGDLREVADQRAQKFARQPGRELAGGQDSIDIENVQVWDLFDAFSRLMESIGHRPTHEDVIYDDTPVELHAADILDRLTREGAMTFERVFEGRNIRTEIIGLFLALLELIRQKKIDAVQDDNFSQIRIRPWPASPGDVAGSPGAAGGGYSADQGSGQAGGKGQNEDVSNPLQGGGVSAGLVDQPADGSAGNDAEPREDDGRYVSDTSEGDS